MSKSPIKLALALIAGATVNSVILAPPTMAGQLSSERTFDHPPSLVRVATSNPATQFPSTDNVEPQELIAASIRYVDGRNNYWEVAPDETRHL